MFAIVEYVMMIFQPYIIYIRNRFLNKR